MSKRARITLDPETASESDADTEPTPSQRAPDRATSNRPGGVVHPSGPALPTKGTVNIGRLIKTVLAGVAVASLLLLWLKKRP